MKIGRIVVCSALSALTLSAFCGCSESNPLDEAVIGENSFIMTLYPDIAPETCQNFQKLVDEGFYNGLTFHRVADNFVVQGGDPNGDGTGTSGTAIKGEFKDNGVANNLSHVRGTVSMARAADYDSASCQFFICLTDLTYLDGSYAAFGNVTEGMEVIDSFLDVPRTAGRMGEISLPEVPVIIKYAGTVGTDSAGNPQIQFVIEIGDEENSSGTDKATETETSETTASQTTATEAAVTGSEPAASSYTTSDAAVSSSLADAMTSESSTSVSSQTETETSAPMN